MDQFCPCGRPHPADDRVPRPSTCAFTCRPLRLKRPSPPAENPRRARQDTATMITTRARRQDRELRWSTGFPPAAATDRHTHRRFGRGDFLARGWGRGHRTLLRRKAAHRTAGSQEIATDRSHRRRTVRAGARASALLAIENGCQTGRALRHKPITGRAGGPSKPVLPLRRREGGHHKHIGRIVIAGRPALTDPKSAGLPVRGSVARL